MDKLNVFLSWSGKRSLAVAEALRDWLPDVLLPVDAWLSAIDLEKGTKWRQAISGAVEGANFAVICLTPENLGASWLLFEAGALSKNADSRVCTYLFDLEPTQVRDPLSQFQHTKATKVDTRKLIETMNAHLGGLMLPRDRLERVFETWWPTLESRLSEIPARTADQERRAGPQRRIDDMIAEILERVREHERLLQDLRKAVTRPGALDALAVPNDPMKAATARELLAEGLSQIGLRVTNLTFGNGGFLLNGTRLLPQAAVSDFLSGRSSIAEVLMRSRTFVPTVEEENTNTQTAAPAGAEG